MFTPDRSGTVPNRTGPGRLMFTWNCLEPVQVFTRDLSGTGPDRIRYWTCKTARPVLDPFRTGSRTVPCKQKAYPVRKSDRIRSGPVPCKHSLIFKSQCHPKCFARGGTFFIYEKSAIFLIVVKSDLYLLPSLPLAI